METSVDYLINLTHKALMDKFQIWVDHHKDVIGDKWYKRLNREIKKISKDTEITIPKVMGHSLWIFNIISNFGVLAGLGPSEVNYQGCLNPKINEKLTRILLELCASSLSLQYLRR